MIVTSWTGNIISDVHFDEVDMDYSVANTITFTYKWNSQVQAVVVETLDTNVPPRTTSIKRTV